MSPLDRTAENAPHACLDAKALQNEQETGIVSSAFRQRDRGKSGSLTQGNMSLQNAQISLFNPSNAGDELQQQQTQQLGNLHKRRVSTSPEKFNTGKFQPLPLQSVYQNVDGPPPSKKRRIDSNLEIRYNSSGMPRIAAFSAMGHGHNGDNRCSTELPSRPFTAPPSKASLPSPLRGQIVSSFLLNNPLFTPKARDFNIFTALCRQPELLRYFVSFLNLPSLISLYSISKTFHRRFNEYQTAFILSSMRTWAPNADIIYPWSCYRSLCLYDPHKRSSQLSKEHQDAFLPENIKQKWRDVPSLRWLQMVVWREGICKDMLIQLAVQGLRCPPGTLDAIKRLWFILDLPLNSHRKALMHNQAYMSDDVIDRATHFLLKVDMHFTDPVPPTVSRLYLNQQRFPIQLAGRTLSGVNLRKTLLAERHFTPLWRVLRGWSCDTRKARVPMTSNDILRLWVRHYYEPNENALPVWILRQSIMGIPWWEVGTARLERTGVALHSLADNEAENPPPDLLSSIDPSILGTQNMTAHRTAQYSYRYEILYPHRRRLEVLNEKPREILLRPDELCLVESVRRHLGLCNRWIDMMLYGFCDELGKNFPVYTEEEILRMCRGLPARPEVVVDEEMGDGQIEDKDKNTKENDQRLKRERNGRNEKKDRDTKDARASNWIFPFDQPRQVGK